MCSKKQIFFLHAVLCADSICWASFFRAHFQCFMLVFLACPCKFTLVAAGSWSAFEQKNLQQIRKLPVCLQRCSSSWGFLQSYIMSPSFHRKIKSDSRNWFPQISFTQPPLGASLHFLSFLFERGKSCEGSALAAQADVRVDGEEH